MAKELPYFQFEPAEYLTGDISFCSLSAQGLFTNLCCYYWQRCCKLTKEQFLRRINAEKEFNELISENIIEIVDGYIKIKFLDIQFNKATNKSDTNSINGSKGGRPSKKNPNESEIKPKLNPNESESKGIREDKIIENEINNIYNKFVDEVKSNNFDSRIEALHINLKIQKGSLTELISEYKNHLISENRLHKTTNDFFINFKNWLNIQDRLKKLDKYKV